MPFDGTPTIDWARQLPAFESLIPHAAELVRTRPIPSWYLSGQRPETVDATIAVLVRAREIISDEPQWCKRSFAVTWLDIPVHAGSRSARRVCALGAIKRAGRELRLSVDDATRALEWQTIRPVADWNDDKVRTHAEVTAAFDAAVAAFDTAAV